MLSSFFHCSLPWETGQQRDTLRFHFYHVVMTVFDSHFHLLGMLEHGLEPALPPSIIGIECATVPDDGEKRIRLVGSTPDVYLSMGAGPWCTSSAYPLSVDESIKALEREISLYGADAVGECGFDFHWKDYGRKEEQERLFVAQAEIASDLAVPLIIHSREADEVLLRHLSLINERTIMHCFSSAPDTMLPLLERGAYISFAGNVTYRNSRPIQEDAKLCPIERLLYETDSPYLTPVPLRGQMNRMENSEHTLTFLASLRGEDRDYIKENAVKNLRSLMKNRVSVVRREI